MLDIAPAVKTSETTEVRLYGAFSRHQWRARFINTVYKP
jgi:hypothetical protein